MRRMIPYSRQTITQDDIDAVEAALKSDLLTTGPRIREFEEKLCSVTTAKHVAVCSNGTTALHLACDALGIGKGDLVITSPLTFLASANCAEFCGAEVDFVDIDPATLCLSPEKLEQRCKSGRMPKAVIAVSFAGFVADLPALWELSKRFNFSLIEDAAHSLGSSYRVEGRDFQSGSCAHSHLATLSFHPVKNICTAEGGAVTTNDSKMIDRVRLMRSHGMRKDSADFGFEEGAWAYQMSEVGYNYRITDIQCALGISQIARLSAIKTRRRELHDLYGELLSGIKTIISPRVPSGQSPCPHIYTVQFTEGAKRRRQIYDFLASRGIQCQVHYIPVHLQPYYRDKYGYGRGKCPAAEKYYEGCLSLPMYPDLSDEEVKRIVTQIKEGLSIGL